LTAAESFLPAWPLQLPPLLWFAVTLVVAAIVGEAFFRRLRLPRITGYVLAGLVAGSLGGGGIVRGELVGPNGAVGWAAILVELALGVLLFELGNRVNLRWLRDNPWLLATSALEAVLTFGAVYALLTWLQVATNEALLVAAISMATAPAIVMRVVVESRAQGQVSDRLLVLTALNTIYTVIAVQLMMGWLHQSYRGDLVSAVLHPVYLLAGAALAGAAIGGLLRVLRNRLLLDDDHAAAVLVGIVLAAVLVLKMLKLPVLLTLLLAGLLMRNVLGRPYVWPRGLHAVTGLLVVTLFVLTGIAVELSYLMTGGLIALALIALRTLAKTGAVLMLARPSGITLKQGVALGAALTPMSGVAFVLTYDLLAVFPELAPRVAATVLAAIAILELFGPIVVRWVLVWTQETGEAEAPPVPPARVRPPLVSVRAADTGAPPAPSDEPPEPTEPTPPSPTRPVTLRRAA
jgi:Kef-type K+ transport system membrane component KefB